MANLNVALENKDCRVALKELIDSGIQVDSVVTDPPYELGFMGKSWDSTGITYQTEVWELVFKVLKPGGHLLSFGGSRTYHRMAVAIEDAGFEIRDQIMWIYGSGFPKSLNIGKAIDKKQGNERDVVGYNDEWIKKNRASVERGQDTKNRSFQSKGLTDKQAGYQNPQTIGEITKGNTEWEGWGTALKPAHEPIVMARKPLSEKTVADNVLKHGTGGINIDGGRIPTDEKLSMGSNNRENAVMNFGMKDNKNSQEQNILGRFPANIIHDGSDEVKSRFPKSVDGVAVGKNKDGEVYHSHSTGEIYGARKNYKSKKVGYKGSGSAARFFYCAKASKKERDMNLDTFKEPQSGSYNFRVDGSLAGNKTSMRKNTHPTVKPIALMRYLCRLVTPRGGAVLDPFMGSGSTGIAALEEGFNFRGIELNKEYFDIAKARIAHFEPEQLSLL